MIAAVLLAAGAGRRFGARSKLLQDLHGAPIVRRSADALRHPAIGELIVVVPPANAELRAALDGVSARFVVNPDPDLGMGASIAHGVAALGAGIEAAFIALADEPAVHPSVIDRLAVVLGGGGAGRSGGAATRRITIVVPVFQGVRGHPVLFDRAVFAELAELSAGGDAGARAITDRDPGRVVYLEQDRPKPIDVDTVEDLARLRRHDHHTPTSTG